MAKKEAKEPKRPKRPGEGRPTLYTKELADLICLKVATSSYGLMKLTKMYDELPNVDTIYEWRYKYREFSEQYAAAKLKQADFMAEEIIEIADNGENDWMETSDDGGGAAWKLNGEHVQRSKLRIDTRKWLASKLLPKTYGNLTEEQKEHENSLVEKLADKLIDK